MLIGILQTGHVPPDLSRFGSYPSMFQRFLSGRGLSFRTFAVVDGELPSDPAECDGWLITGSRHGVYEDHTWIPPLEALVRRAVRDGVPLVGVCFGHQLVAQALGGKVGKYPGGWTCGPHEYEWDGKRVKLLAMHQDQVLALPPGAVVTMRGETCEYAGFNVGERVMTVQPHPEFEKDYLAELLRVRRGVIPPDVVDAAEGRMGWEVDREAVAEAVAGFFLRARKEGQAAGETD
ncbi:glutamine amidotransferase, class I [Hyaloraphidium curvatum]|nr:glutamine amidotransferase, class I [Hyaloraphidium curvatum]